MLLISVLVLVVIFVASYLYIKRQKPVSLKGKHVMITGGSKGIGKAIAIEAVKAGANVSILARNIEDLDAAKLAILKLISSPEAQKVVTFAVDVSSDLYTLEQVVSDAETECGPVFMLINCAGTSVSYRFDETPLPEFRRMMEVNYMGSVMCTRAVLPSMKAQNEGIILFVSSIAGLLGLYGYSAYSASKFALVGLAESLYMELKPFGISVTLSFPPDTDTPGFEEEQKTKPTETRLISESGGLFSAETVAKAALSDALKGRFASTVGFESLMVKTVCSGMMPVTSLCELGWQILTMPIFRAVSAFFLNSCHKIVAKCALEKRQNKKEEEQSGDHSE